MSLFDDQLPTAGGAESSSGDVVGTPLAERMRPRTLDEIVGQDEVLGEKGFLRQAIARDRVPSLVFWGPPGCGKTTLALIIAQATNSRFVSFSAVTTGIKEVKEVMTAAARLRRSAGQRTLVFVDEIHRFNKAQQDAFLPFVERGDIVLVGATTENPSFEVNSALLSRCRVVVLAALGEAGLVELMERALADDERGLAEDGGAVEAKSEALHSLAALAGGDARSALNLLELAVLEADGAAVDHAVVERVAQRRVLLYDKAGEEHFNLISALHKSLRESDPDAALYWLARMLESGEDPRYLARRMVRFASEDIGLADPRALDQALAGWQAYERLGSPEGDLALAQVCLYLALAPKSVAAYKAFKEARRTVRERPADPVPMAIRNAPTDLMKDVGYGEGYVYAPDTEHGVGGIDCLPESLQGTRFYRPGGEGFESRLAERLERFRALKSQARSELRGEPPRSDRNTE